jgi:hypothetical protein
MEDDEKRLKMDDEEKHGKGVPLPQREGDEEGQRQFAQNKRRRGPPVKKLNPSPPHSAETKGLQYPVNLFQINTVVCMKKIQADHITSLVHPVALAN